jgi:signal transduction histidine kinase
MFGQNQKKGSYENTGVGLGLAYCKMVTDKMHGDIECNSEE